MGHNFKIDDIIICKNPEKYPGNGIIFRYKGYDNIFRDLCNLEPLDIVSPWNTMVTPSELEKNFELCENGQLLYD